AEDGIRDRNVTGVQTVCSSDLILAYLSIGDRMSDLERLVSALAEIRRRYQTDSSGLLSQEYISPEVVTSPQEAFYSGKRSIPLRSEERRVGEESRALWVQNQ